MFVIFELSQLGVPTALPCGGQQKRKLGTSLDY